MRDLRARTALVTGASGGIGPYIARHLHRSGAEVILSGRRREPLTKLAAELDNARVLLADLTDRPSVARLIHDAGDLDILVANAGRQAAGRLIRLDPKDIDEAIEINLRVPIVMTRLVLPQMLRRGEGHIVVMSSMAAKLAGPNASVYNATKFGLRGFGLAMRQELAKSGVGFSTVFPTFVKEAGMWAETGLAAPPLAGEVTPDRVAAAVVTAIKRNRIEVDVAPWTARLGGRLVGAAPDLVAGVVERIGPRGRLNLGEEARRRRGGG